jgi:hypothetical protein
MPCFVARHTVALPSAIASRGRAANRHAHNSALPSAIASCGRAANRHAHHCPAISRRFMWQSCKQTHTLLSCHQPSFHAAGLQTDTHIAVLPSAIASCDRAANRHAHCCPAISHRFTRQGCKQTHTLLSCHQPSLHATGLQTDTHTTALPSAIASCGRAISNTRIAALPSAVASRGRAANRHTQHSPAICRSVTQQGNNQHTHCCPAICRSVTQQGNNQRTHCCPAICRSFPQQGNNQHTHCCPAICRSFPQQGNNQRTHLDCQLTCRSP